MVWGISQLGKQTKRSRRKFGSIFDDLSSARGAKHPTYRYLKLAEAFDIGQKIQAFKYMDTRFLARSHRLSVSYVSGCRNLANKMGVPANMEYALENYEEIRVGTLVHIANAKKKDYRTIRRMLEREVLGKAKRAGYGSNKEDQDRVVTKSSPSLGNWSSVEASPGMEYCAEQLFNATRCKTRVNQLDNGIIEVSFKCLALGDLDHLLALILE